MQHVFRLLALFAVLAFGVGLFSATGPGADAQDPQGTTYQLGFRWTMPTWAGPDGIAPEDALRGTGAGAGGDDVFDVVTAVYGYDGDAWRGFFPAGIGIPQVNQLASLENGAAYWIAINDPDGAEWTIAPPPIEERRVGALLSITGPGSTLGAVSQAALEIAVARWNEILADEGSHIRLILDIEDTQLDPELAVAAFNELVDRGAKVIVGPQSSSELAAIGELADAEGVLVVSHGSTASSIAGMFQNVFRFVPTDVAEGEAITDLMVDDGIEAVVPLWRNDSGNEGLANSVRAFGAAAGLTVTDGTMYEGDAEDYDAPLAEVATQVATAVAEHGAGNVAVYLAGFEEVANVLAAASAVEGLDEVRWYGGDGSARAAQLIDVAGSADFAIMVGGYPNPLIGLPNGFETEHAALVQAIMDMAGVAPDAFGLAAYDAANALVEAMIAADNGDLRDTFIGIADGYEGVTGTIDLNENQDRSTAPFEFWSICDDGAGGAEWILTGTWAPEGGGTLAAGSCEAGIP